MTKACRRRAVRGLGPLPQWRAYADGSNCPKRPRNVTFQVRPLAPDWPIKATGEPRAPNTEPRQRPTEAAAYTEGSEQNSLKKFGGKINYRVKRVQHEHFVLRPPTGPEPRRQLAVRKRRNRLRYP
jgi:hypothetical protein